MAEGSPQVCEHSVQMGCVREWIMVVVGWGAVIGEHDNFCRPLEDYGPRSDIMEERQVCQTSFEKDCQPVTVSDCMDVTELRCEVNLFTNCSMDWHMKDSLESLMSVSYITKANSINDKILIIRIILLHLYFLVL